MNVRYLEHPVLKELDPILEAYKQQIEFLNFSIEDLKQKIINLEHQTRKNREDLIYGLDDMSRKLRY